MSEPAYAVSELAVTARALAGVRASVPRGRVGAEFRTHLDQVYAAARTGALNLDGQNVLIYRAGPGNDLLVEFCVGVKEPFAAIGSVVPIATPSGMVAATTHWGDYGRLGDAHAAVLAWCRAHDRVLAGPSWEVYGHWYDDPAKLRTDLFYLLETDTPSG